MSLRTAVAVFVLIQFAVAKIDRDVENTRKIFLFAFDSRDPSNEQQAKTVAKLKSSWKLSSKLSVKAVDCFQQQYDACKFVDDKATSAFLLLDENQVTDVYEGQRDLESLREYCLSLVSGRSKRSLPASIPANATYIAPHLTSKTFYEEIKSNYTFVIYYAPWCNHCKKWSPFWNKLSNLYKDNNYVKVRAVDSVAEKSLYEREGINGFPTMLMYHEGEMKGEYDNGRNMDQLQEFIDSFLSEEGKKKYDAAEKRRKIASDKAKAKKAAKAAAKGAKIESEKSRKARESCSVPKEEEHAMCVPEWVK